MSGAAPQSRHFYPPEALRGDYLRAFAGAAICGFPFLVTPMHAIAIVILGSLALLFAVHGGRTLLRRLETVVMDDTGLTAGVLYRRHVNWRELDHVGLRYYSTRRDRSEGWMQLGLRSKGGRVAIDSEIEGFVDICRSVRDAARANGLDLGETTIRNLRAIGIDAADLAPGSSVVARSDTAVAGSRKGGWGDPTGWRR